VREIIEGPTVDPGGTTPVPLVVESDRVVLGVHDRHGAALLTFRDGSVRVARWMRHDLAELDARQAAAGRRLVRRTEDRAGRAFTDTSAWHVSEYA
jgi:hypothetical protein